jgi:hypothetical protein
MAAQRGHAGRTTKAVPNRTADGSVVNRALAAQVLRRYWPVHERALVHRDLATLARLSTGSARRWEQPAVACGCLHVTEPRPLLSAAYFVPRQTRYPATFIAEAQTVYDSSYWAELLVFTKQHAGASWLVTEDSGFGPPAGTTPQLGAPVAGAGGYDRPVTAAQHHRARKVVAAFAAVWQRAKDTGTIPTGSGFDLTGQTGERVAQLAMYRQDAVQVNGLLGHFAFSASAADPLVVVADTFGYDLACQPIHETVQYRPTPGKLVNQDAARHNWGPELKPGFYHQVVSRDVWQTCFLIPPGASRPIAVLNQSIGGAVATGTR